MGAVLPITPFFAYQQRWIDDRSQLKFCIKSRQVGLTFAETWDIVMYLLSVPKSRWYYLSVSEDRAAEAIEYAVAHCLVMGALVDLEQDEVQFEDCSYKRLTITAPNGSQMIGLPANPRTARGVSGNVTFDEFGHHLDAYAIWRGAAAAITWGYRARIITTPNGKQGKAYDVWTDNGKHDTDDIEDALRRGVQPIGDPWSRHFVDIYMAKEDGHPVDLATARSIAGDDYTWHQEYCGKFLDEDLVWLPYSLIDKAHDVGATMRLADGQPPVGPLFLGYDVGRKRDLSVAFISERLPGSGRLLQKACLELKQSDFDTQENVLNDAIPLCSKGCIDATGIGAQLAERMEKRWYSRVEGVSMTGDMPARIAANMKLYYQRGMVGITDDARLRRSLHAIRRQHTPSGQSIRYDAPRTKDGHADHFWAQGLSIEAHERTGSMTYDVEQAGDPRRFAESVGRSGWDGY